MTGRGESPLRGYFGNTDFDWYEYLRERPHLEEVNFWQPSGSRAFRAIEPGAPFFFKLKSPHNAIGGFGYFAHASKRVPLSLAWEAFTDQNGVGSLAEMRDRVFRYRRKLPDPRTDPEIGCLMISQPVFFSEYEWVKQPRSWPRQAVQGKTHDLTQGEGARVWMECLERARASGRAGPAIGDPQPGEDQQRFGKSTLVKPRLGQGTFRVAVLDAYSRSCAVTTEHSVPVLESAHIRPYSEGGTHEVSNGLLLRADIHRLFDRGLVTVTPDLTFRVSPELRDTWRNGRVYYELDGRSVRVPALTEAAPSREALEWHASTRFRT